jgi:hypothetical protein
MLLNDTKYHCMMQRGSSFRICDMRIGSASAIRISLVQAGCNSEILFVFLLFGDNFLTVRNVSRVGHKELGNHARGPAEIGAQRSCEGSLKSLVTRSIAFFQYRLRSVALAFAYGENPRKRAAIFPNYSRLRC